LKLVADRRHCRIEQVGRSRSGQPRWWCAVHGGNASGRNGTKLEACDATYVDADLANCLYVDPADYAGGIAVWAALPPVFDTTNRSPVSGIHVHARQELLEGKQIDGTYPAVAVRGRQDLFGERSLLVTCNAAVNYYFSRLVGRRVKHLNCPRCNEVHLDAGWFAVHPHRQHLCQGCGRFFRDHDAAVSNPIAFIREALGDLDSRRQPVRANENLDIRQSDYPGGIQIWASNPAVLWTAPRPEQEGIHVHLFSGSSGPPVIDETFNQVRIDGILLDDAMVHYLMAQQALPHVAGLLEVLCCPNCSGAHVDRDEHAFKPHGEHACEHCGAVFRAPGRRRLSVSNPLLATLERLRRLVPDLDSVETQQ
jgi:Zn-finger nucleic acid-binding protein